MVRPNVTLHPASHTFAVEKRGETQMLCAIDVHGNAKAIAMFLDGNSAELFKQTLNLTKAASHAHGASGI